MRRAYLCAALAAGIAWSAAAADDIPWVYRSENHPADVVASASAELADPLDAVAVATGTTESWSIDSIIAAFGRSIAAGLNTLKAGFVFSLR